MTSAVNLGHGLGLRVVAESVEGRAAWDLLAAMGCDVAPAYYIGQPLPGGDLARVLRGSPGVAA